MSSNLGNSWDICRRLNENQELLAHIRDLIEKVDTLEDHEAILTIIKHRISSLEKVANSMDKVRRNNKKGEDKAFTKMDGQNLPLTED